ncbi:hypothetical protein T492DRAFT_851006 [Pavlovales sp. CCMP2436]|nr:hypothetical protein T492DRAFT_851006 [Pavlovales sp. CCMP2436]
MEDYSACPPQGRAMSVPTLRPLNLTVQCAAVPPRQAFTRLNADQVAKLSKNARAMRELFLASADDRWGLVVALLSTLGSSIDSARERILFKLAVLAADEVTAANLIDAGVLPELTAVLESESTPNAHYAACALAALAQHASCAQLFVKRGALDAALYGLAHAAVPSDGDALSRGRQLGVAYACAAAVASLCCWEQGAAEAELVAELVAMAPALCELLVADEASVVVPTAAWLLEGKPTFVKNARIAGGGARCALNLALRHPVLRGALREAGAARSLDALVADGQQVILLQ